MQSNPSMPCNLILRATVSAPSDSAPRNPQQEKARAQVALPSSQWPRAASKDVGGKCSTETQVPEGTVAPDLTADGHASDRLCRATS